MRIRRRHTAPQVGTVVELRSPDGACVLRFGRLAPETRAGLGFVIASLSFAAEQYGLAIARAQAGDARHLEQPQIDNEAIERVITALSAHLLAVEGLEDEEGKALTLEDLTPDEVRDLLWTGGHLWLMRVITRLVTEDGIGQEVQRELAAYLASSRTKLTRPVDLSPIVAWCLAQHDTLVGEGSPEATAPLWLQQIHAIIRGERHERARLRAIAEDEQAVLKKHGLK
jgi:hypothetical protein